MKFLSLVITLAATFSIFATTADAHGGGCRKASPPGQCCHADNSNGGQVHCH